MPNQRNPEKVHMGFWATKAEQRMIDKLCWEMDMDRSRLMITLAEKYPLEKKRPSETKKLLLAALKWWAEVGSKHFDSTPWWVTRSLEMMPQDRRPKKTE